MNTRQDERCSGASETDESLVGVQSAFGSVRVNSGTCLYSARTQPACASVKLTPGAAACWSLAEIF